VSTTVFGVSMIGGTLIDLLLSPSVMIAAVILLAALILLLIKRKDLSYAMKVLLVIAMVLCLLYLIFIIWLAVMFGAPSPHEPVPAMPQAK